MRSGILGKPMTLSGNNHGGPTPAPTVAPVKFGFTYELSCTDTWNVSHGYPPRVGGPRVYGWRPTRRWAARASIRVHQRLQRNEQRYLNPDGTRVPNAVSESAYEVLNAPVVDTKAAKKKLIKIERDLSK